MRSTASDPWSDDESHFSDYSPVATDSGHSSGSSSCVSSVPNSSIQSLSVEKCKDFHVGPKIINNHHVLDGDPNWVTKLSNQLYGPDKVKQWQSYRRLIVGLLVVLAALLIALVAVEVMRWRKEEDTGPMPVNSLTTLGPLTDQPSPATANPEPWTTTATARTTIQPSTTTQPQPTPKVVSRISWGGMDPPETCRGTEYQVRYIFFDNINEPRCAGNSTLIKCIEDESNKTAKVKKALEFNFLIDGNGTVYEVRGWDFKAEDNDIFREAFKIGFVGENANDNQVESLRRITTQSKTHITYSYQLVPVCCRDLDDERGPDTSVICHLWQSELQYNLLPCFLEVQNCDKRSWIWRKMPVDICNNWIRPF